MSRGVSGKAFDFKLFNRVMRLTRPYRKVFWWALFLTILVAGLGVVRPLLIGQTIDFYVVEPDPEGLLYFILLIVGLLVLEAIVQFFQTYYSNWLGQSVTIDLRSDLFSHLTKFRLKFFDRTAIGTLVTRVISDIETIAQIFASGLLQIMGDLLRLIVVIVAMFVVNWQLALYSMAPIPVLMVATYIFKNAIKRAFQSVRTQVARLNAYVQEHITGMAIVQAFNREKTEAKRFREINAGHRKAHIRSVWAYSIFFPVVEMLSATSLALLIWWGVGGVLENEVTLGELVTFIMFISMMYRPIRQLADRFNVLQMGMVGSDRVFNLLDLQEQLSSDGTETHEIKGKVEFDKVWFSYNPEEYVLRELSFTVEQGETVAIVGSTGAGKTTIINLLNRFYDYQKGAIRIDGTRLEDYEVRHLRRHIGVVLQDVFLFSDTIMNNITLHDESISREEVIEASKAVGAHEFIKRLPGEYDYDVKERGGMLSVGQRQLIAFIRAFVYNPSILILDEATSSVDTETEMLIQRAIEKLTANRTSIVIAHRLSTIQRASKIIVMEKGQIAEMGTHDELLSQNGKYKKLYELQFATA